MPETVKDMTTPAPGSGSDETDVMPHSPKNSFTTGPAEDAAAPVSALQSADAELPWFRINWEIKALVPIACVLLGGMLLFLLATVSWRDPERHAVLFVAGAGAVHR